MPVSKQTRKSRHEQAENPTLQRGNPASSEGRVGTQQFRNIAGKGLVHMVRSETGWKEMGSSQSSTNQGDKVESTTISAGISATSSSVGGGAAVSVHGNLTSLSEDDHSQYVHLSNVRTITGNHVFSGAPQFNNINVDGGDIASGTTINKSPVITLAGDLGGNATLTNLGNATLTATIQPNSVALATDTTGNYMTNVTGNSQVSVSHSQGEGSTAALSIAGDSIGDTQLAYNTGQHLTTSSSPTFATVNTGQGANELYAMNQNVRTSDNVQFGDIIVDGDDITSNPFSSGFTGGGWKIDSTAHAEFSSASIRGTLSVYELLLQQLRATNGSVLITAVAKVESIDSNDITFEDPSDNGVCPFHTNDIVMVQRADLTGTSGADNGGGTLNIIRRIVRRVTSVSGRTITVTRDGDLPSDTGSFGVGDDVVRIGNTTNTNRDAILYLSADDSKAPYLVIKDGVNSWANWNSASTEKARLGRLDGITDTDAGLSGSQSNTYGLYSDNVHLKGHIFATSGKIGGISMASSKIYTGTGTHNNANTGFYIDSSSNFSLGNKLSWNGSTLSITGDITISNTGDFAPTNATNNRSDSATDSAVNSASKTGGSVGGWSLSGSAITGSNIVMSSNGTIAVANGYSLNNDGSASFANGGITFATNGDITSNTFLIERTRLFGAGEDGTCILYAGTVESTYEGGNNTNQVNSQHGESIITRSGNTWSMQGDCYFDTLTISNSGGALRLNTNGFRLFVKNTFTIASSCYVSCNGSQPSGYDDGDAHGGGSANGTLSRGAQGHAGGAVGIGSSTNGGRGGAAGGGGGIVFIAARLISNSGYIEAKGGNGHAGQQGGSD